MHRPFVVVVAIMGLIVAALASGCASHADAGADDKELVSECRSYLRALSHCQQGVNADVATQRTVATRQAFLISAKDQAARDRLGAQCRAAEHQLSRACR